LIQGNDGDFYGTTFNGGPSNDGTLFKMSTSGDVTMLYSFSGSDGAGPYGGLIQASDGNFYGTTEKGGPTGDGTVFRMTPSGAVTTLHFFVGDDGANPFAGLTRAAMEISMERRTGAA
jgi:uncharacterized repeat protein (TIGR03803 family)